MKKFAFFFSHDYNNKNSLIHRISEFHYRSEFYIMRVDSFMQHPWIELQGLIKEKWLTQKAFSLILWKKVSEVNELLKWKRNITIQRDYLLHQTLWTPIKYRILKQVDYDYSLLNIDSEIKNNEDILSQTNNSPSSEANESDFSNNNEDTTPSIQKDEEIQHNNTNISQNTDNTLSKKAEESQDQTEQTSQSQETNPNINPAEIDNESVKNNDKILNETSSKVDAETVSTTEQDENRTNNEYNDEDFKERANIFRNF